MLAVLSRLMTGPSLEYDAPERRDGYVTFRTLLEALKQANEPQTRAIEHLERSLTAKLDQQDARISAIEIWKDHQEDAEMVRESIKRNVLRVLKWMIERPGSLWPVVALILGLVWMVTGHPPVGVGPIQP